MSRPDHTFVVLAYEENPALEACIASLAAQSIASTIIMTTSTPNRHIAALAARYAIELVVNAERRGIAADWNFGLAAADTRYVTLAHQDDVYERSFLARSLTALAHADDAAIAFTRASEIDGAGCARTSKVSLAKDLLLRVFAGRRPRVAGRRAQLLLSFGNPISCSTVTFDRLRVPTFRFEDGLASNLDWAAWVSLVESGHALAYVPDVLVERRYDERTATSALLKDGRRAREDRIMFERLWSKPVAALVARAYALGY